MMTDRRKRHMIKPHRLVAMLGALWLCAPFSAIAQPEITPPTDVVGPAIQTDAVTPVFYLDLADVAPLINVNIDNTDPTSGTLDFTPTGTIGPFPPGSSNLSWTVTNADLSTQTINQNISIFPQVNFHMDQRLTEGSTNNLVIAEMTGPAPTIEPVLIKIKLTGTAQKAIPLQDKEGYEPGGDYTVTALSESNYTVEIIPPSLQASVVLDILSDTVADDQETVIFNMSEVINADVGYRKQNTYTTEFSYLYRPMVEIAVSQNTKTTQIIDVDGGEVNVKANIDYNAKSPIKVYDWRGSDAVFSSQIPVDAVQTNTFVFDPAGIPSGHYTLTVTLSDGFDSKGNVVSPRTHHLQVEVAQGTELTNRYNTNPSADDDGDGIDDVTEGFQDDDNDGIPNYLDNISQAYLLASSDFSPFVADTVNNGSVSQNGTTLSWQASNTVSNLVNYSNLIVAEPGAILSLGDTAKRLKQSNARVPVNLFSPTVDANYLSTSGALWDLQVNMVHPDNRGSINFVIPLIKPLPKSEVSPLTLFILDETNKFVQFTLELGINELSTAKRDQDGYCPPPRSELYTYGIIEEMECLQVAIRDGSGMDRDLPSDPDAKNSELNGRVNFSGGIFTHRLVDCPCDVVTSSTTAPTLASLFSINNIINKSVVTDLDTQVNLVIPLDIPLPTTNAGALNFYLLKDPLAPEDLISWQEFIVTADDRVASAPRNDLGYCPPPGSQLYVDGIQGGNDCIQLTMIDNGFNDRNSSFNEITAEGGVFVAGLIDSEAPSLDTLTQLPDHVGALQLTSNSPVIIPHFDIDLLPLPALVPGGFDVSDASSGTTRVVPTGPLGPLPSGHHDVSWTITDLNNNSAPIHKQAIDVLPQFNFGVDQVIPATAGTLVTVTAHLDGFAANYPVTIPFTISGSAGFTPPLTNVIEISEPNTQGSQTFNLTGGLASQNIVISLDTGAALINAAAGTKTSQTITLRADNAPPIAQLTSSHANIPTRTIVKGQGKNVVVTSFIFDPDTPIGDISYDWSQTDPAIVPLSGVQTNAFSFNPDQLADGLYTVRLTVGDGVTRAQNTHVEQVIRILSTAQQFTPGLDSDGDRITDDIERLDDADTDGIPNFLDAVANQHWLQAWPITVFNAELQSNKRFSSDNFVINWSIDTLVSNKVYYPLLISTEPGLKLSLGDTAFIADVGHARVPIQTVARLTQAPFDSENNTSVDGYMIDVEISQLNTTGQHVTVNIPLTAPIPKASSNPQFFILNQANVWTQFAPSATTDYIQTSLKGDNGYCPPHSTPLLTYTPGVNAYHECLQLSVSDGGPNDADGLANGIIKLRGSLFIKTGITIPPSETQPGEHEVVISSQSQNKNDAGSGGGGAILWWIAALTGLMVYRRIGQ